MTSTTPATPPAGLRLKLAEFPEGAVALNLDNGAYFRLNATARDICRQLQANIPPAAVVRDLAAAYSLTLEQATRDVAAVLARLQAVAPTAADNPLSFVRDGSRWLLHWEQQPVLALSDHGRHISAHAAEGALPDVESIAGQLLWAAPHLLALQGHLVLHASAVRLAADVVAFCGPSGVGKTTLATTSSSVGAALVSEDLVPIRFHQGQTVAVIGGEARLRAWAAEQALNLAAGHSIDGSQLADLLPTDLAPLAEIWFIERPGHTQPFIAKARCPAPDALAVLLHNSFAEWQLPAVWEQLFDSLSQLAGALPVFRVQLPHGLEVLRQAVTTHIRMVMGNVPPSV